MVSKITFESKRLIDETIHETQNRMRKEAEKMKGKVEKEEQATIVWATSPGWHIDGGKITLDWPFKRYPQT